MRNIVRSAPVIRRFRKSIKTSASTPPFINRMWGARCCDDRRFSSFTPAVPRVVIGTYVSRIAEIYLGLFFMHYLDFRIILLEPPLHQSLVAFDRTAQWLLAGDTELRQLTPHQI
jgi:hypothetical protein